MRVVFLLTRYTKFFEAVIIGVSKITYVKSVVVCYWDNDHLPVEPDTKLKNVKFIKRKDIISKFLFDKKESNLVYVPGWMDKGYLKIIKKYRKKCSIITCVGFDDQWHWSIREFFGAIFFRLFLKKLFDYAWVAGPPQYMYARMFGFKTKKIGYNLLSANISKKLENKEVNTKKIKLVFVGRLVKEKNLINFLRVFSNLNLDNLTLDVIGEGYLEKELKTFSSNKIKFHGYLPPKEVSDILIKSDVFVLPSKNEQWSVALHEAVNHGLLVLSSENVGANSVFLIEGYNGYAFNPESQNSISKAILRLANLTEKEIIIHKKASDKLASSIDVEMTVASFLSFNLK